MPRIYVNGPHTIRLNLEEMKALKIDKHEVALAKGWNTIHPDLLDHWFVKALVAKSGQPVIPDGEPVPVPAKSEGDPGDPSAGAGDDGAGSQEANTGSGQDDGGNAGSEANTSAPAEAPALARPAGARPASVKPSQRR